MKSFKIEIPKGYVIDEKKSTFENIVFKKINTKYVDLGLPSGTLWADTNEVGYYSYQDAIDTFGKNNLPKLTDFAELYDYCKWRWDNEEKGMVVTGPNGNHIVLPASGFRYPMNDNKIFNVDDKGYYWSSTSYTGTGSFNLCFYKNGDISPSSYSEYRSGLSIRKIARK